MATLPGRGTGCAAGVWVFRADAPSFGKTEEQHDQLSFVSGT